MIGLDEVPRRIGGLDAATLEIWVAHGWVRPARQGGRPVFEEIDIARVRLILELRDSMEVGDQAMPVVLSLLDQLHATRDEMRRLCAALEAAGEAPVREVLRRLGRKPG